jgi:hypothetical protein
MSETQAAQQLSEELIRDVYGITASLNNSFDST